MRDCVLEPLYEDSPRHIENIIVGRFTHFVHDDVDYTHVRQVRYFVKELS